MRESFHPKGVHRGSQALKQASGIVTFLGTMGKCLPRYNILEEGLTLHHYLRAQFSMAENEEVANHCDSRHLLTSADQDTERDPCHSQPPFSVPPLYSVWHPGSLNGITHIQGESSLPRTSSVETPSQTCSEVHLPGGSKSNQAGSEDEPSQPVWSTEKRASESGPQTKKTQTGLPCVQGVLLTSSGHGPWNEGHRSLHRLGLLLITWEEQVKLMWEKTQHKGIHFQLKSVPHRDRGHWVRGLCRKYINMKNLWID